MYKGLDGDDLRSSVSGIDEAMKLIRSAKDLILGTVLENRNGFADELDDIINDLADELPNVQHAVAEANRAEEDEERREYERSVC